MLRGEDISGKDKDKKVKKDEDGPPPISNAVRAAIFLQRDILKCL